MAPEDLFGVCQETGVTLNRYMMELSKRGIIDEDMASIFNSLREATKVIGKLVKRAPMAQREPLGPEGAVNVQGENQKTLDVIANEVLKKALQYIGRLGVLASKEEDNPAPRDDFVNRTLDGEVISHGEALLTETGKYVCVFDPLDGSSNVEGGVAVGTVFGIYRESDDMGVCNVPRALTS